MTDAARELLTPEFPEVGRVLDLSEDGKKRVLHFLTRQQIRDNTLNYRESLPDIQQLAETIDRHGLLENLVGVEIPPFQRAHPEEWVELKAGSRRLSAIDLLIRTGRWDPKKPIPVLLIDGDGFWQSLVENVQRVDAEPWEIGRRLSEAASGGLTYKEISKYVGRSNGYVSRHIAIAQGLAPEAILYIKQKKLQIRIGDLHRLSFLRNKYGDPDAEQQTTALSRMHQRPKRTKRRPDAVQRYATRLYYMKTEMPVPPLLRPIVQAILDYIEGGRAPNFRAIHEQLIGDRVRIFGDDPEP